MGSPRIQEEEYIIIHPPYLIFYIESLKINCELAFNSIDMMNREIKRFDETGKNEINENIIIGNVQNIILQAGNISKYFFPISKKKICVERGAELRKRFNISDDNILRDKSIRNAIEHLDERIDKYFELSRAGYFFPSYVGYEVLDDHNLGTFFRAYFLDTHKLTILEEEYFLEPIINEINSCYAIIKQSC